MVVSLKKIPLLIILASLCVLSSCYYDKEDLLYPTNCISANDVKGPKFTEVEALIKSSCNGCHLNGGNDGGYNFDGVCNIVNSWNAIYNSCVIRSDMPPGSPLNANQKQMITDWVNAGHRYTD